MGSFVVICFSVWRCFRLKCRRYAIEAIKKHHWPGNVRELENAIERACILSDTLVLQPKDLGLGPSGAAESESVEQLDLSGTLSEVAHRALSVVERKKIL